MSCGGGHLGYPIGIKNTHLKLPRNDHWKVLYKFYVFYADRKSKMAATAIHKLALDPMGKCSNAFFSETTFDRHKKNINFVEDLPMTYSWAVWIQLAKWFERRSVLEHFPHMVQC
jgi:hypothetical protein